MNRPSTWWILTSLASLESWHSQLSNDTKIIISRAILMHFAATLWFLVIFGRFFSTKKSAFLTHFGDIWYENDQNARKMQNMATKCINIARLMMILASLESWECQLSNDAKLVKIRPVEGRFVTMFWFNIHTSYPQMRPEWVMRYKPWLWCSFDSIRKFIRDKNIT